MTTLTVNISGGVHGCSRRLFLIERKKTKKKKSQRELGREIHGSLARPQLPFSPEFSSLGSLKKDKLSVLRRPVPKGEDHHDSSGRLARPKGS